MRYAGVLMRRIPGQIPGQFTRQIPGQFTRQFTQLHSCGGLVWA